MRGALLAKAWRDSRFLLVSLMAVMLVFPWVNVWVSSMISLPAFTDFLTNAVPQRFERLSAVPFSQLATPAGRVAISYAHPIILLTAAMWAIARGSDCVSGEIGRGTMELLLAQPVRRTTLFATQALVTLLGSVVLALAVWCGTAVGLATVELPAEVPASLFVAPSLALFGWMVAIGGVAAMVSSCDSQRWRTVGLVSAWVVVSMILDVIGRAVDGWHWLTYASFMSDYTPQAMVARPEEAWSLLAYQGKAVTGLGLGGQQLVLLGLGIVGYVAGAVIFSRRELPGPL